MRQEHAAHDVERDQSPLGSRPPVLDTLLSVDPGFEFFTSTKDHASTATRYVAISMEILWGRQLGPAQTNAAGFSCKPELS